MNNRKQSWLNMFEGIVVTVALILLGIGIGKHSIEADPLTWISMLVLTTGTEMIKIPLSTDAYTTLTSSVAVGIVMIKGPDMASIIMAIAALLVPILKRENYRRIFVFNGANYVLCIYGSSFLTQQLLSYAAYPIHANLFTVDFFSILCMMLIFHIINHVLLDFLFFLRDGNKNLKIFWQVFLVDGIHHFLGAPLVILMIELQEYLKYYVLALIPLAMMGQGLKLNRTLTATQKVQQFASQLNKELDFDTIAIQAVRYIAEISEAKNVAFWIMDETRSKLTPRFWAYPETECPPPKVVDFTKEEDRGLLYAVVQSRNPEQIHRVSKDKRAIYRGDKPSYESMMIFPLIARNEVIGVCTCYGKRPYAFLKETFQLISTFTLQVGVILENARLYADLQEAVIRDGTTGLYNYRHFYRELSRRFAIAKEQQLPFSVAVIDIDYFKRFNDTYGHLVGDQVIRHVGTILTNEIGNRGLVARYGGEEFAVLLDLDAQASFDLLETIRRSVQSQSLEYEGFRIGGVSFSAGIASYPSHGADAKLLLEKADQALYWGAKQRGRNKTAIYAEQLDKSLYVDSKTQLFTFHYLTLCLSEVFQLRCDISSFALICLKIQDYDHLVISCGDKLDGILQELAMVIRGSVRQEEIACRYTDSEFVLFVPGIERFEAEKIMERIVKKIAGHSFHLGNNVRIVIHMLADILVYPGDIPSTERILRRIPDLFQELENQSLQSRENIR
jgi:diguanylate cyclase (GGDEF)-like protein